MVRHRLLRIGKKGEAKATSDDAGAGNDTARVYAVADGASVSFLPGPWAQFLVDAACTSGLPTKRELTRWLAGPREQWRKRQAEAAAGGAWWNNQGRRGAATFCGIAVEHKNDLVEWSAVTIGDACVFLVCGNNLLRSLPLESSAGFNSTPRCLFSTPSDPEPEINIWKDNATTEDVFILATDALAKWLLQRHEAGMPVWNRISQIASEDELLQLVDQERDANRMENDDVTLLVVRMEKEPDTDVNFVQSATEPSRSFTREQDHQQKSIAKTSAAQSLPAYHTTRKPPTRKESTLDESTKLAEPSPAYHAARKPSSRKVSTLDEPIELAEPKRNKSDTKGRAPSYPNIMFVSAVVSAVVSVLVSFWIQTRGSAQNSAPVTPSSGNATTAPSRGTPPTATVSRRDASVSSSIPSASASTVTNVTIAGWVDCSQKKYGANPKDAQHQFEAQEPVYDDKDGDRMRGKLLQKAEYRVTEHHIRSADKFNRCQIQIDSSNLTQ
ncbi:MAG: protein phosphatase 2C domain-containing protein [Polyangiaceae bacterium]|nr:protein phosphatase 2C domain-containing protein [Polyangiaceae bacterium]